MLENAGWRLHKQFLFIRLIDVISAHQHLDHVGFRLEYIVDVAADDADISDHFRQDLLRHQIFINRLQICRRGRRNRVERVESESGIGIKVHDSVGISSHAVNFAADGRKVLELGIAHKAC